MRLSHLRFLFGGASARVSFGFKQNDGAVFCESRAHRLHARVVDVAEAHLQRLHRVRARERVAQLPRTALPNGVVGNIEVTDALTVRGACGGMRKEPPTASARQKQQK